LTHGDHCHTGAAPVDKIRHSTAEVIQSGLVHKVAVHVIFISGVGNLLQELALMLQIVLVVMLQIVLVVIYEGLRLSRLLCPPPLIPVLFLSFSRNPFFLPPLFHLFHYTNPRYYSIENTRFFPFVNNNNNWFVLLQYKCFFY